MTNNISNSTTSALLSHSGEELQFKDAINIAAYDKQTLTDIYKAGEVPQYDMQSFEDNKLALGPLAAAIPAAAKFFAGLTVSELATAGVVSVGGGVVAYAAGSQINENIKTTGTAFPGLQQNNGALVFDQKSETASASGVQGVDISENIISKSPATLDVNNGISGFQTNSNFGKTDVKEMAWWNPFSWGSEPSSEEITEEITNEPQAVHPEAIAAAHNLGKQDREDAIVIDGKLQIDEQLTKELLNSSDPEVRAIGKGRAGQ